MRQRPMRLQYQLRRRQSARENQWHRIFRCDQIAASRSYLQALLSFRLRLLKRRPTIWLIRDPRPEQVAGFLHKSVV
ncbi:hypothetical protein U1Q18_016099 [Sarracenia purpurea var. burkii]